MKALHMLVLFNLCHHASNWLPVWSTVC